MMVLSSRRGARTPALCYIWRTRIQRLLYHLSYPRICCGSWSRTNGLVVMGHASYQLLYPAMFPTTKIDNLSYSAKSSLNLYIILPHSQHLYCLCSVNSQQYFLLLISVVLMYNKLRHQHTQSISQLSQIQSFAYLRRNISIYHLH